MEHRASTEDADKLSVIVVNYNAGAGVVDLIHSLARDTCVDRIAVVDNASSDGSADALAAVSPPPAKLELIRNAVNRGFAAANNQGVAFTRGRYLLFVNPDVRMQAGMLDGLCQVMDDYPQAGMLGILIRNADGSEQRGCRRYLPNPRRSFMHLLGVDGYPRRDGIAGFNLTNSPLPSGPVEIEAISGAFMLVRRRALVEVGAWDEGYFLHCEDLDLCMRFKQAGWKILFVPGISAIHEQGVSSRGRPLFVLWQKHLGMWRYFAKFHRRHGSPWLSALVWLGIWSRFLVLVPATALRSASRQGCGGA